MMRHGASVTPIRGTSNVPNFSGSSAMLVHNLHTSPSTVVDTTAASQSSSGNSTNHALNLRISRSTVVDTIAALRNSRAGYRTSN